MARANSRRRIAHDSDEGDGGVPETVRDPGPTFLVIGVRLMSAILLVVALVVGQWASATATLTDAEKRSVEVRVVYGLSEALVARADGGGYVTLDTQPFSSASFGGEAAGAAGTSKTAGLAVGAAMLLAIGLAAASLGHSSAHPGLGRCAGFAFLATGVAVLLGLWFRFGGLVGDARAAIASLLPRSSGLTVPASVSAKSAGGFSFYVAILALIFLAIAWARSAVAGVDERRRQRVRSRSGQLSRGKTSGTRGGRRT